MKKLKTLDFANSRAINIARKDNLEPTKKVLNKILKKGYFKFDRYTLEGI